MNSFDRACARLREKPERWLITGVAGFIGSNLLEALLRMSQHVVGLDDFSTGSQRNLDQVRSLVSPAEWSRFTFIEGDIADLDTCREAVTGVDHVLHQAALGSVPRSISDPVKTNRSNVDGFLNMLVATRDAGVERIVYAASSSTYGDLAELPKVESRIGNPLSPYAVTKYVNELYADVFSRCYGLRSLGLRYFNVFGPRQDPDGPYAAVIPRWISAMVRNESAQIFGDGETSRDFCYIQNAIQANILAATTANPDALDQVFNVAVGARTSLNDLHDLIRAELVTMMPTLDPPPPEYLDFRPGDVRHSLADIQKAKRMLGYDPSHDISAGMKESIRWYAAESTPR